jgi:hypothetical protein
LYDTTFLDYGANFGTGSSNGRGYPGLITFVWCPNNAGFIQNGVNQVWRWGNGDAVTQDPIVAWGLTSVTDEPQIRCQLWDSIIIQDIFFGDTTTSFDSHNWIACTSTMTSGYTATLFFVTP